MEPEGSLSYSQNSDPELSWTKWIAPALSYLRSIISTLLSSYTCARSSNSRFSSASGLHCWSHTLYFTSLIMFSKQYKIWRAPLCRHLHPAVTFFTLGKNTNPHRIFGGQSGTGTDFFIWVRRSFSVSIISLMHRLIHSYITYATWF